MRRHGVIVLSVYSFNDVNFSPVWPLSRCTKHPECLPASADRSRHVRKVKYDETMLVGCFAFYPHRFSTLAGRCVVVVYTDVDLIVVGAV